MLELFILVITICVLTWLVCGRQGRVIVPGPITLPFLGNVLQMDFRKPHQALERLGRSFKGGVFKVSVLGNVKVVVTESETIREWLVRNGKFFNTRAQSYRILLASNFRKYPAGIFHSPPDDVWRHFRLTVHASLKLYDSGLKNLQYIASRVGEEMVGQVLARAGKEFDPYDVIYQAIMNNAMAFLTGRKHDIGDDIYRRVNSLDLKKKTLFSPIGKPSKLDLFPWLRHFGNETYTGIVRFVRERGEMFRELRQEVAGEGDDYRELGERTMVVEALLREWDAGKFGEEGEARMEEAVGDLVTASVVTSVTAFYTMINTLAHEPEVLRTLQAEMDAKVGRRDLELADQDRLPYLRAVILENLRYQSIVPIIPRQTSQEVRLSGHVIPAGTEVLFNAWAAHHNPADWPDPFTFKPERFLTPDMDLVSVDHQNRKRLFAFGGGARTCPGEMFARNRLFLLAGILLQRFDIQKGTDEVSCDPRNFEMGLVLSPTKYKIKMLPRW